MMQFGLKKFFNIGVGAQIASYLGSWTRRRFGLGYRALAWVFLHIIECFKPRGRDPACECGSLGIPSTQCCVGGLVRRENW